ncbi:unnamed protein product [Linum trigynum]|uniref:S-protein homolog n=1 Tax=Linum trigynum TaxID=586398 RepID=A0AAV2D5A7_9ROSI
MRLATQNRLLLLGLSMGIIFLTMLNNYSSCRRRQLEYDVRVINGFTNNSSLALVIWCSSGGENFGDMGGRALQEGDDFSWTSMTTTDCFFGSSSDDVNVVCTVKWDLRKREFDAFKATRDVRRCDRLRKCSWLVKEDGFYFSNDEVNWKKDFSWS